MDSIDEQTTRWLEESARRLDGDAMAPERAYPEPGGLDERSLRDKQPGSSNPKPADLSFKTADEARDVSAKLDRFQRESLDMKDAVGLDLIKSWRQSQQTSREHVNAQEEYILAAIRLLIEEHAWSPRLFDNASVTYGNTQIDGNTTESVLRVMNELGVRKKLPFGGEVAARWVWESSEELRTSVTGQYEQSSRIVLDGAVPLLRGAGDVAQETRIQARRDLVYAARTFEDFRRSFMVAIARDYFNLLLSQDSIASQERQLESLKQLEVRQAEWFRAGRVPEFEVNLARNNVLNAEASLANLKEQYILSLDRYKVRLGLPVSTRVEILPFELPVPQPEVGLAEAAGLALAYRLDLQNQRDQVDDVKRGVRNAKNALLPDLNLAGNLTLPTDADAREGGVVYEPDDVAYSTALTFGVPLDREVERLQLRAAIISLGRAERDYDKARDDVVLEVRARVREIERARLNLVLAEERVKITQRRQEEQKIKEDEVDTQARVDTANDLLQAERARDQARTDVRNAVLDYLLSTGQLRVKRDGTFEPLPGMVAGTAPPATDAPPPDVAPPAPPATEPPLSQTAPNADPAPPEEPAVPEPQPSQPPR